MKSDENAPLAVSLKCTEADFERLKAYGEPFESPGRALSRALDRAELLIIGDTPIREEVIFFAREMEKRLRENDHKGGWLGEPFEYFASGIRHELGELDEAMKDDLMVTLFDFVAIGNFAMMGADVARRRWENSGRPIDDGEAPRER